jgi:nucleoside-diphosphate-sugar epimerase
MKRQHWTGAERMRVAVSGGTGFLGRHIIAALRAHGHQPVSLSRRPFAENEVPHLPLDLASTCPSAEDFRRLEIEALIHCAWDFGSPNTAQYGRANIEGARRLVEAATQAGVKRLLDISSMSAFPGCRSTYGHTKLAVEAIFADAGGMVLRPGLIWGESAGSIVGTLDGLVRRLPVVPLIGSGNHALFLVHVEDLAELVCRIVAAPVFPAGRLVTAAVDEPVPLRRILELRAQRLGVARAFLPVPWRLIWLLLRAVETVAPGRGPRSDSVLGFIYSDPAPRFEALHQLAPGFRGFRRFTAPAPAGGN